MFMSVVVSHLPHVCSGRHKVKITPRHDRDGNHPFFIPTRSGYKVPGVFLLFEKN